MQKGKICAKEESRSMFFFSEEGIKEIIFACNESFTFHVEIFHVLVEVFIVATSLNINIRK